MQGTGQHRGGNPLVDEIMNLARGQQAQSQTGSSSGVFTGRAKKLTDTDDPTDVYVPPGPRDASSDEEEDEEPIIRVITFWSDGFTLGPQNRLRAYTDPRNAALLTSIRAGTAPLSELGVQPGQPVDLRVAQRSEEPYGTDKQEKLWKEIEQAEGKKAKKPAKPFSGASRRLGDLPDPKPKAASVATSAAPVVKDESIGFDATKETTKLQIRCIDGSKHTIKFNPDHTIEDIHKTVERLSGQPGQLLSGRPPAPLPDDLCITIREAKLEGSVIFQQLHK